MNSVILTVIFYSTTVYTPVPLVKEFSNMRECVIYVNKEIIPREQQLPRIKQKLCELKGK